MIMDLSVHFKIHDNPTPSDIEIQKFFHNISYIGISEAVVEIINASPIISYIILFAMVVFLLSPILTVVQIFAVTAF